MKFYYKNFVKWQGDKKGLLSSHGKHNFEIATPPEFNGHAGYWSPEDLLVASVNSCIMTTFLHFAQRKGLDFLSYESHAEGALERVENKFMISKITIKPSIIIKEESGIKKAESIMRLSEKSCLISNSIKSEIEVIPEIQYNKTYENK